MFKKMKFGTIVGGSFPLVLVMMLFVGGFSIVQMAKLNGFSAEIATNWLPPVRAVEAMATNSDAGGMPGEQHFVRF
jgi:hypothetical protein